MKAIQTTNKEGSSKPGLRNDHYIKYSHSINKIGLLSAFAFALLALTSLFPISKGEQNTEAVTGTAQSSSLTLSVSDNTASVELDVNSPEGTFASSSSDTSAAFSVTTNNFSGYTLSISSSDDDGKLYDKTKRYFLEPLTSAVSEADFSSAANLNGKWGYKPSKFNSAVNNNYLPAPTTAASTLDTTATANATANDYTISLGLRADYNTTANTYTNAFVLTAVPNPIAYVITYDANTTDTVSNMPAAQNSTTSATEITLSDKTPAREGYDFKGWCTTAPTEANADTCTGTTFRPGTTYGIDQTTQNITTLYAMWWKVGNVIAFNLLEGATVTFNGVDYSNGDTITLPEGDYTIATKTFPSGTGFYNWESTAGTFSNSTSPSTVYTVSKNATISINGGSGYPYMQDLLWSECKTLAADAPITAIDRRDNKLYTIDYINDACWMTQNLRVASGTKLTALDSNVASDYTIPANDLTLGDSNTEARLHDSGDVTLGYYYNYCAASAGSVCEERDRSTAVYSVCPKGWRLPTYQEFSAFIENGTYNDLKAALYGGYYYGGAFVGGTIDSYSDNYWSSTASTFFHQTGRYIYYHSGGRTSSRQGHSYSTKRVYGYHVRCVRSAPSIIIHFDGNGATGGAMMDQQIMAGTTQKLTSNNFTLAGKTFTGWNYNANGTGLSESDEEDFSYSAPETNPDLNVTLYAQWADASLAVNGSYMQNLTWAQCNKSSIGATATLVDSRDNSSYTVAKLPDGNCWMTQNLRLAGGTTITSTNSNVSSSYTIPTTAFDTNTYTAGRVQNSGNTIQGYWYNYCAASAGTICTSSSTSETAYSICPKGWRLPTRSEADAITNDSSHGSASLFNPVDGGYWSNGKNYSDTLGGWWTSTKGSSSSSRSMLYYRSEYDLANNESGVLTTNGHSKQHGLFVRCIFPGQ